MFLINQLSAIGRLCEKCDGKWCVIATNVSMQLSLILLSAPYVIPTSVQRPLCEFATNAILEHMEDVVSSVVLRVRCSTVREAFCINLICIGISDAYYCAECTRLEKDRDGCPKIVNLGASRTDLFYERRRLGESTRSDIPSLYAILMNS